MNWLAHILLSKNTVDYQLGNLLADPLKGKPWSGCSEQVLDGFKMHSRIDVFTDANLHVRKSKSRLGRKGYLKGVVIDVAYDHLLVKNWDRYVGIEPGKLTDTFHQQALQACESYPIQAKSFVQGIVQHNILNSYKSLDDLGKTFARMDRRLSQRILAKETLSEYLPVLRAEITAIDEDFSAFFPELITHFKDSSSLSADEHWLK